MDSQPDSDRDPNPAITRARAIFRGLAASGVAHVCVCPGGRSAPLVFALAERPEWTPTVHVDERGAGFFALGLARELGAPVAIVTTSGTAVANLLPAVVEASLLDIPLILLTADRPAELVDVGAGQAIDQTHIFGRNVRWFCDLSEPRDTLRDADYAHQVATRASALAGGPRPGPVHLNLPFRKPLHPQGEHGPRQAVQALEPTLDHGASFAALSDQLVERIAVSRRPVVIAGASPLHDADAVARFTAELDIPLLADPISGLRASSRAITRYDGFLRGVLDPRFEPDLVVRFGPMPTSKALTDAIAKWSPRLRLLVDPHRRFLDPFAQGAETLFASTASSVAVLSGALEQSQWEAGWTQRWASLDARAEALLNEPSRIPPDLRVMRSVLRTLGPNDRLHVASSMPIRDLELAAGPGSPPLTANRGSNGIDGTFSTAAGISFAHRDRPGRTWVVAGDLASIHDLGGLVNSRIHGVRLNIVIVNNDGGGIFGMLPMARFGDTFDRYFSTPHGLGFEHAAHFAGADYEVVEDLSRLDGALRREPVGDLRIVEVRTDRRANLEAYRRIWDRMASLSILDVP